MHKLQSSDVETLEIASLKKSFGSLAVFEDASLDMRQGEAVVVIGRTGSGGSNLLNAIAQLRGIDAERPHCS